MVATSWTKAATASTFFAATVHLLFAPRSLHLRYQLAHFVADMPAEGLLQFLEPLGEELFTGCLGFALPKCNDGKGWRYSCKPTFRMRKPAALAICDQYGATARSLLLFERQTETGR
jgi:hypothetical protein